MIRDDKRIESIRLVGVGPFEDTTINFPTNSRKDLAEVHIFTGGNGAGKSTILYCLANMFTHPQLIANNPQSDVLKRFRNLESKIYFKKNGADYQLGWEDRASFPAMQLVCGGAGYPNLFTSRLDAKSVLAELTNFLNTHNWQIYKFDLLPLAYSGQRPLDKANQGALAIKEISQSPLEKHLAFGQSVDPNLISQWIANIEAKEALALKDNKPNRAKALRQSLDVVTQAINEITEDALIFSLDSSTLDVVIKRGDQSLSFDVLPDGLKSIISWVADVLMRMDRLPWANPDVPLLEQPLILFLDEIDIHLHPKWQRRVLPVVQKLFPNAQIFVSTHSPFVVASVEDAWVYEMSQGEKNAEGTFVVKAEKSGAGKSYELVLAETFDITEPFVDPQTNRLLDAMRIERDALFADKAHSPFEFLRVTDLLAQRSEQLARIVGLECRQLAKHGLDLTMTKH